jgi:hypothetical protein
MNATRYTAFEHSPYLRSASTSAPGVAATVASLRKMAVVLDQHGSPSGDCISIAEAVLKKSGVAAIRIKR